MKILWAFPLIVAGLAGCLSGDTDADGNAPTPPVDMGGNGSHPAYGFATYDGLDGLSIPAAWTPLDPRELPGDINGLEHVAHVEGVATGAGIAVFGHLAFAGSYGGNPGMDVIDISDPAAPTVVSSVEGAQMRDAETIAYPDGRLVVVGASGRGAFTVTDVTDPAAPVLLGSVETLHNNHNLAVVPGTPLVYNSPSGGGATDIWDLSDPENPELVADWENGQGCHDIMWHIDRANEMYRGYCAGIGVTQIWNITDPRNPSVISETPFPEFLPGTGFRFPLSLSHLAMVNHDATVLIVGDETGGGAIPGCDVGLTDPVTGTTVSGPLGNLWFYDISDEANPQLRGHVSLSQFLAPGTCTAHFGRVIEDRNQLVMAYYGGGVVLVDFNDLDNPEVLDQWLPVTPDFPTPGDTWDAWYYRGYVFTGDLARGMDVLAFT